MTSPPACRGLTDLFYSEAPADIHRSRIICGSCPHRAPCLSAATERRERYGVWGGEDFNARRNRRNR